MQEIRVVVDFLEELFICIELIEDLLLLSLQALSLLEDALIVIDLLETWILPNSCQNLALLVGNVVDHNLSELVTVIESLSQKTGLSVIYHILYIIIL